MNILTAPLENIVLSERSSLSADVLVGQTILTINNSQGFETNKYVILGEIGSETSKIHLISTIEDNTISLTTATVFAYSKNTPIQIVRYNQRKFYRSSTKGGIYIHLASEGSPVNIEVDEPDGTMFEDSMGTSTSWYKATYFNSTTMIESSIDDAIATKAGDSEHYTSIHKIRVEAGFQNNPYIGSDLIDRFRAEAEAQAEGAVVGIYKLPFTSTPKLFQHIVTLLSAGLLLSKEYGLEVDVEVSKTGQRKIERAEELLEKIRDSKILLIGENGVELSKRTDIMASNSNTYDVNIGNRGEMFNISDEHFIFTNPSEPLSDSRRSKINNIGFN